jgi:hypothetical protein
MRYSTPFIFAFECHVIATFYYHRLLLTGAAPISTVMHRLLTGRN